MSKSLSRLLAAMTCAASLSVYATDDADSRKPLQGKAAPQAAIDACNGLTEKDSRQFTGHENPEISGVCALSPSNSEVNAL